MIFRTAQLALLIGSVWAAAAGIEVKINDRSDKPLADAIVFAEPSSGKAPKGKLSAIMDQIDKEFVPLVLAVQTGTAVAFPNKDNTRHQVYSFSTTKKFDLKLYAGTPAEPVVFDKPGLVTLGCNIHDWMLAYVYVVDTPWFGKTDAKGVAKIAELPAGDYTLKAWHPNLTSEPLAQSFKQAAAEGNASFKLPVSGKIAPPNRNDNY